MEAMIPSSKLASPYQWDKHSLVEQGPNLSPLSISPSPRHLFISYLSDLCWCLNL